MGNLRVDFEAIDWETPIEGVRHKVVVHSDRQLRLVEYYPNMPAHWCERGHYGYILAGRFEVEFPDRVEVFQQGDGVWIPSGHESRHRARVLSDVVRAVFVEDV